MTIGIEANGPDMAGTNAEGREPSKTQWQFHGEVPRPAVGNVAANRLTTSEEAIAGSEAASGVNRMPGAAPYSVPRVSVVVPTLNEAENLRTLLPQLPEWLHEVIVVDGRSVDDTVEVARQLCPKARIVLEPKKGKGAALRRGFAAATGDIIVMLDADCSMHPREIILLVAALLVGGDFAKGSRFIQGGGTVDMSLFRMLGNWGLTQTVRMLYGGSFTDLCYGYLAFWTKHLPLLLPNCDGFEVETFLNIQALKADLKIVEVPSFEALRLHGESNLRAIPDGWRVLKTILRELVEPLELTSAAR